MSWRGIVAGLVLAVAVLGVRSALPPPTESPPYLHEARDGAFLGGGR